MSKTQKIESKEGQIILTVGLLLMQNLINGYVNEEGDEKSAALLKTNRYTNAHPLYFVLAPYISNLVRLV